MFEEDDDETGSFGMIAGLVLFLVVGGLLFGASLPSPTQSAAFMYSQPR
jgi:hypothetical protein